MKPNPRDLLTLDDQLYYNDTTPYFLVCATIAGFVTIAATISIPITHLTPLDIFNVFFYSFFVSVCGLIVTRIKMYNIGYVLHSNKLFKNFYQNIAFPDFKYWSVGSTVHINGTDIGTYQGVHDNCCVFLQNNNTVKIIPLLVMRILRSKIKNLSYEMELSKIISKSANSNVESHEIIKQLKKDYGVAV